MYHTHTHTHMTCKKGRYSVLLIKGQTDSDGTDGRQLKGWKIVFIYNTTTGIVESMVRRRALGLRSVYRDGQKAWDDACARRSRPSDHLLTRPRYSVSGPARAFVSGRHLSWQPFNSANGGCCFVVIIKLWKPTDVSEKFTEKLPTLSDSCVRVLLMTLFRRPIDYDVFLTAIPQSTNHWHHINFPTPPPPLCSPTIISFTTAATLSFLVCQWTFLRFMLPIDNSVATFFVVFKTTNK